MKTLKAVLKDNSERADLINAVIEQIGYDSIQDVISHGADSGFSGFIYYADTCAFYEKHRTHINMWLKNTASELGENVVEMVGAFGCLKAYDYKSKKWNDTELHDYIGVCVYGGQLDPDSHTVENALAWFALEEVCRLFD